MTYVSTTLNSIKLLVIHPLGRSGSLFLQSLFDGHPEVITLPSFGELFSKLPNKITDPSYSTKQFIENNQQIFDSSKGYLGLGINFVAGKFGPNATEDLSVDPSEFLKNMMVIVSRFNHKNDEIDRVNFFKMLHLAYHSTVNNGNSGAIKYILYHPHIETEFNLLIENFPCCHFIFTMRDPRQDWASWRKVIAIRQAYDSSSLNRLDILNTSLAYSRSVASLFDIVELLGPNRVKVIELPKLHQYNKQAMRLFCQWLSISFRDSLLQSTFNGMLWHGNSADRVKAIGFNPLFKDNWKDDLTFNEAKYISTLLFATIALLRFDTEPKYSLKDFNKTQNRVLSRKNIRQELMQSCKVSLFSCLSPIRNQASAIAYVKQFGARVIRFLKSLQRATQYQKIRRTETCKQFEELKQQQTQLINSKRSSDIFLID